ncbi:UDP-galactose/UDP-glucose transporter 1 [Hibiscus syriacus]|uniref:UDP-galactose/UDP-glucose transporter 1 n=1 Tax=Hibiscus syriacus TaxID=106335 RepID=A0A6A3C6G9_HIBSY|nr:UDP-galactose/UDP-glucose transporter 1 [Hibiscus syriacus]
MGVSSNNSFRLLGLFLSFVVKSQAWKLTLQNMMIIGGNAKCKPNEIWTWPITPIQRNSPTITTSMLPSKTNLNYPFLGFALGTTGGKDDEFYVVTDESDDVVDPKPGTLRYAVIQTRPLWIAFSHYMVIKLKESTLKIRNNLSRNFLPTLKPLTIIIEQNPNSYTPPHPPKTTTAQNPTPSYFQGHESVNPHSKQNLNVSKQPSTLLVSEIIESNDYPHPISPSRNPQLIEQTHACLGPRFTWCNHQVDRPLSRKLDRVMVSTSWHLGFPKSFEEVLVPERSKKEGGETVLERRRNGSSQRRTPASSIVGILNSRDLVCLYLPGSTKRFGSDGKRFEHLAFLNLAQNVVCLVWSYIMIKLWSSGSSGGAPWWTYWSAGITNTIGPAMGSGQILKNDSWVQTSSKTISKLAHPNAPLGYGLCFLNLALDGFTNAMQDSITASENPVEKKKMKNNTSNTKLILLHPYI